MSVLLVVEFRRMARITARSVLDPYIGPFQAASERDRWDGGAGLAWRRASFLTGAESSSVPQDIGTLDLGPFRLPLAGLFALISRQFARTVDGRVFRRADHTIVSVEVRNRADTGRSGIAIEPASINHSDPQLVDTPTRRAASEPLSPDRIRSK